MPELFDVVDILPTSDLRRLFTLQALGKRWQCSPTFARRRLRAAGIRLVMVPGQGQGSWVRRSDVKALEKAMTIYLSLRPRKAKERTNSSTKIKTTIPAPD